MSNAFEEAYQICEYVACLVLMLGTYVQLYLFDSANGIFLAPPQAKLEVQLLESPSLQNV